MASQKLTERRKLARKTRRALVIYISLLSEEAPVKRKICLQDAQQALDELRDLEAEIEGYDYPSSTSPCGS
jgi:hypothetical protein